MEDNVKEALLDFARQLRLSLYGPLTGIDSDEEVAAYREATKSRWEEQAKRFDSEGNYRG